MPMLWDLWRRLPRRTRAVAAWLAAAAAYVVCRHVGGSAILGSRVEVAWPGLGVAYFVGLVGGPGFALAPALAAFADWALGGGAAGAAAVFGASVYAAALAGHAVARAAPSIQAEESVAGFVLRVLGAVASALVAAVCFRFGLALTGGTMAHGLPRGLGAIFVGDLASILVVGPFLWSWTRPTWRGVAGPAELAALFVLAAGLSEIVASGLLGDLGPTPYLLLCVAFWAAIRAGRRATSTIVVLVAAIDAANTMRGIGPFVAHTASQTAISQGLFVIVLSATALGFAALSYAGATAKERQLASERRYRELVERLPLVTYVNGPTPDEPPRYVSPQIEQMLGYPASAWYEDPRFAYRVIHERDVPILDDLFVVDADDSRRAEYRMVAADGRVVWVLDQMVALRDAAGRQVAVQGFLVDITRQKLLEEQLRRAQRIEALGLLAGGVAHDFNNLLMAISGYTELALASADEPERARGHLREVAATAARAAGLTRQLLAFGRRQPLKQEVVDPNALVRETEHLLRRLLGEGIELVTRLEPELGRVRGDAGQLTQVLLNLAVNARDAMPGGGTLTISTANERVGDAADGRAPGDYVVVAVADTGGGMDAETVEHLFEPFFTTKEVGEGTGLGLAMVHGIVEQSGGRITVSSRPGEGATFRIALPQVAAAASPAQPQAAAAGGGEGDETVLLVEDEDAVRRLTAEMLERLGYRVIAAASPAEALEAGRDWDLLVSDVVMPGMSGPQLAERLRESDAGLAVVFVSGYSGAAVADVEALGAELLQKPYTLAELGRAVREALDARAAAAA